MNLSFRRPEFLKPICACQSASAILALTACALLLAPVPVLAQNALGETAAQAQDVDMPREPSPSETSPSPAPKRLSLATCGTDNVGNGCWWKLKSPEGCVVWLPSKPDGESFWLAVLPHTWTGKCDYSEDNRAYGRGTLQGKGRCATGELVLGKRHGQWIVRDEDGQVFEGPYVDGKRHGRWVEHGPDHVSEGSYVDDKRRGRWVTRWDYGMTAEGPYLNDKRHGEWVWRKDGDTLVREYHYGELVP